MFYLEWLGLIPRSTWGQVGGSSPSPPGSILALAVASPRQGFSKKPQRGRDLESFTSGVSVEVVQLLHRIESGGIGCNDLEIKLLGS